MSILTSEDVNEIIVSMLRDKRMSMKKGREMLHRYTMPDNTEGMQHAIGVTNRREDFIRELFDLLVLLRSREA